MRLHLQFFKPYSIICNNKTCLSSCLWSVACGGVAVKLGRENRVAKLLKEEFPSVILWHFANHRLELSGADTVNSVAGIDRFGIFMGWLCHLSYISDEQRELLKIGKILSTRWWHQVSALFWLSWEVSEAIHWISYGS
jgi:hypothetical protein